jgi:phospholipase/carboxylesterase
MARQAFPWSRLVGAGLFHFAESATEHLIFVPEHYEPGYAYPLLVWLHGVGHNEEQLLRIMPFVSLRNYVAVAPRGYAETLPEGGVRLSWPQSPEGLEWAASAVAAAIAGVHERYHIAPHRIFLAGQDMGGSMALRLAMDSPQQFAGVASLLGGFPKWERPFRSLRDQRRISVLLLTGLRSRRLPPPEACLVVKLLHRAGIDVVLRQYNCGDQLHQAMLRDLNRWMMGEVTGHKAFLEHSTQGHTP